MPLPMQVLHGKLRLLKPKHAPSAPLHSAGFTRRRANWDDWQRAGMRKMTSPRYGLLAEVQNSLCTHLILRGCSDRLAASRSSAENGVNVLVEGSCNKTIAKIISAYTPCNEERNESVAFQTTDTFMPSGKFCCILCNCCVTDRASCIGFVVAIA